MEEIKILGIDTAKSVFQVTAMNVSGKVIFQKRLSREGLARFVSNLSKCIIGMEACCGTNHWARKFRNMGHEVRVISPQYVKPCVKTNKNDANDSQAICEAVSRPTMRFVPIKSVEQQNIQSLHRIREKYIKDRTSLINQIRGFLLEHGIIIPKSVCKFRKKLPEILDDYDNELPDLMRTLIRDLGAVANLNLVYKFSRCNQGESLIS